MAVGGSSAAGGAGGSGGGQCEHLTKGLPEQVPDEPGSYELSLAHDGMERMYILDIPTGYDGTSPRPQTLVLHGGGSNAKTMRLGPGAGLRALAEQTNVILAFPQGFPGAESSGYAGVHCCGAALLCGVDDVGFIATLVATLSQALSIDAKRIYATGHSNGAILTHRLAAELPEVFAAVAANAGTIGGQFTADYPEAVIEPTGRIPILLVHGENDHNVSYDGSWNAKGRRDISFAESVAFWVDNNGCGSTPNTSTKPNGNHVVTVSEYSGCTNGADVQSISIEGHGHEWPSEKNTDGYDGTTDIASFLMAHAKP